MAIVIGGTSAELTMKTVKMASIKALDGLPVEGNALGHAWRDLEWEAEILQITRDLGIGAQFGGKYVTKVVMSMNSWPPWATVYSVVMPFACCIVVVEQEGSSIVNLNCPFTNEEP